MIRIILLITLSLFVSVKCNQKSQTKESTSRPLLSHDSFDYKFVHELDGINLREKPDKSSQRIALLTYGTKVYINKNSGISYETNGIKSFWIEILTEANQRGFIFGGFLSKFPPISEPHKPSGIFRYFRDNFNLDYSPSKIINNKRIFEATSSDVSFHETSWNEKGLVHTRRIIKFNNFSTLDSFLLIKGFYSELKKWNFSERKKLENMIIWKREELESGRLYITIEKLNDNSSEIQLYSIAHDI